MKGIAFAGAVVLALLGPAIAQADEDVYLVDTISDSGALNTCSAAAGDCSLRGAFGLVDDGDPLTDTDTINFTGAVFDGLETVPGEATIVLGSGVTSDENLIVAANCSAVAPCAGIDGPPPGDNAISHTTGTLSVNGLAIFDTAGSGSALFYGGPSQGLTLFNNWFGLRLDGTVDGNPNGVSLSGSNSQIGVVGAAPNVFAGNATGLQVFASDDHTIQNNLFGVKADGATAAANTEQDIEINGNGGGDDPNGIVVGATPNATPVCDAGCNVIAAAGGPSTRGVSLVAGAGSSTARGVEITGNHIGVNTAGTASTGTGLLVAVGGADEVAVSGNRMAGGLFAVTAGNDAEDLVVEDNSIGANADGTGVLDGAVVASILANPNPSASALIRGNLIAQESPGQAVVVGQAGAVIDENQIGITGVPGSGGSVAIAVQGPDHQVEENTIVETTGDAIALTDISDVDVAGNSAAGIGGDGIQVSASGGNSTSNTLGGTDPARANDFSDVAGSAIKIVGDGQDQNQILMNLGASDDFFIDLEGIDGPGNGLGGPNAEIESPKVKKVKKDEVSGEGAPGGEIWVYRTKSDAGDFPFDLKKLVGTKNVKNDGTWKLKPDNKIKGKHVITALQIDELGNSSELSKGKKPK
ncbi:MAG: hypothetical protein QOF73_3698 [Thermomicrobiales bacterium]|nr:hypothetical protein [Thermomicrobiales bacterium]